MVNIEDTSDTIITVIELKVWPDWLPVKPEVLTPVSFPLLSKQMKSSLHLHRVWPSKHLGWCALQSAQKLEKIELKSTVFPHSFIAVPFGKKFEASTTCQVVMILL